MKLRTFILEVLPFLILVFAFVCAPNLGTWYGSVWPAAARMELTHAERVGDVIVFDGRSERLQFACSPLRLEWFLGDRNGHNVPVVVNWGPPIKQPNGHFVFSGWIAEMDNLTAFEYETFADVIHRCRLFARVDPQTQEASGGWELPFEIVTRFYR